MGFLSYFGLLVGAGCLLVAVLSVINTAFELHWALSFSGSKTALPDTYEACAGLAAAGVVLIGLSLFGSYVAGRFRAARGRPLVRLGILLGALALLVVVGRGLQIVALKSTYGSMLAYYATDGDLEDVKAELAKKPSAEDLDEAVSRAAQYSNAPALALLMEAGADMRAATRPEARRSCPLDGTSAAFIQVALEHGVTPATCPQGDHAIWQQVNDKPDDEAAKAVALLAKAGWSPNARPEHSKESAAQLAQRLGKKATRGALDAAGQ